jgi:hypothetical protein
MRCRDWKSSRRIDGRHSLMFETVAAFSSRSSLVSVVVTGRDEAATLSRPNAALVPSMLYLM